eukprot:TRINITY_DN6259_c0_g1_i6.p1 TRINITY_DN6259_c0_g1~~TRINITY_DN6259_c0_g1_i6.p1  ORF type:complete len:413 (-),score=97.97 TRINITY_DN6259_c0_g1_i6:324-1562(-)
MKHWSSKVRAKMAGVDEEKTNYGDLQDQSAILEGVSVKFREIIKETTKNQKYITQQSEADPRISDSLLRTGVDFNEIDRPMLSSTLELVGNFHNVTNDHRLKLLESIQSDVIDNLQSFVSTEIKEAKNQKVEYDRERAKCDEAQNELKIAKKSKKTKPEKLQALEENYQNLQDSHQLVGEKTLRQIKDTQDLAEIDMMERLCDYLDIFREYHTECIRLLNEKVPEIWEYRRYIDEQREEFEQNAEQADKIQYIRRESRAERVCYFGASLQALHSREGTDVPSILSKCIEFLRRVNAKDEEGIFRISGGKDLVDEYKARIDKDLSVDFSDLPDYEMHVIASIMKLWLRTLPDPLIPFSLYDDFLDVANLPYREEKIEKIRSLLVNVSPLFGNCLKYLLGYMHEYVISFIRLIE